MSLEAILRERIGKHGPITVAEYMETALSHPGYGYYMRKDPLGTQGDFITSPEISQIFGELIGAWIAEQWRAMDCPRAALVELGPGRGTLMSDILRATRGVFDFHTSISVHLVETSPALTQKQWQNLAGQHPNIEWHTSLDKLPKVPLLVIANEFFDALPVRQFMHNKDGWNERRVGLASDGKLQFVFVSQKAPPPFAAETALADDVIYEYSEASLSAIGRISDHIVKYGGAAIIVDYGYSFTSSKNQKASGDTLQSVKDHRFHDVLADPGLADLTTHVDFVALKHQAIMQGAATYGPITQGEFLRSLGAIIRAAKLCEGVSASQKTVVISGLERLLSSDGMGDLFKVLAITAPGLEKPEGF